LLVALGKPARDTAFAERARGIVAAWREARAPQLASDAAPILPDRLCAEITRALPEDGILVADTGYSGIWTGTMVDFNGAGQTYLRAAGSLGWSFPASLGAQCAAPHRKVVCFTGDGGFYYHLAELESARRCGIPVTVVVNNNSGFGQNLTGVRRIAGNRPGRGEALVRFGPTDFTAVAKSFGVRGIRVEEASALAPALSAALSADEPVVVDVVTDLEPRAPEPWSPPPSRS
ncbi:MAG: thiamine pyrophosphate-dependent enzyme, partial [Stellaceae bacterium]